MGGQYRVEATKQDKNVLRIMAKNFLFNPVTNVLYHAYFIVLASP